MPRVASNPRGVCLGRPSPLRLPWRWGVGLFADDASRRDQDSRTLPSHTTAGNWLLVGLVPPKRGACELLEPLVHIRVLMLRDDQEQLWVGTVVQRSDSGVLLRLWGSGKLLGVPFGSVLRAGVVPVHTHREHVAVCDLQRQGQPARVCDERKYVELSDEMHARVEAYAEMHGLTLAQSIAKLVDVAQRHLAALARHATRRKAAQSKRKPNRPPVSVASESFTSSA